MGPQLYRCGNAEKVDKRLLSLYLLQWGRNFIVAETGLHAASLCNFRPASMGPQLYRCGNPAETEQQAMTEDASMGPQLYRCGNPEPGSRDGLDLVASMGPQLYRCGNF